MINLKQSIWLREKIGPLILSLPLLSDCFLFQRKENKIGKKELNLLLPHFFSLKIKKVLVKISLPMLTTIIYFARCWGKVKSRNWMSTVRNQLFYDLPTPSPFISPKMALSLKAFPENKLPQFSILHKEVQNCSFSNHGGVWDKADSSIVCGIRAVTCWITWGGKLCSPWNITRSWRTQQKCL